MGAAVEFRNPCLSCLGVEGVYILGDEPVQLPLLLPAPQSPVGTVGLMGRELRPPDEVSGPVSLSGLGAADKLRVLHRSPVGAGVQPDTLRAVIRDARLRRQTRSGDHKQPPGSGHKVLQLLQRAGIGGAASGDEIQLPRRDRGGCPNRSGEKWEEAQGEPHLNERTF